MQRNTAAKVYHKKKPRRKITGGATNKAGAMTDISTLSALIPVQYHGGRQVASGRDIHAYLGLGRDYTTWFKKMTEYGFVEGQDFTPVLGKSTGGRPSVDHAVTFDMAKELGMIQRTAKGKEIRQYFIEVEKQARPQMSDDQIVAQALQITAARVKELEAQAEADRPKVVFADAVSASKTSILVGELAKILRGNGIEIGQNRLFGRLRADGFLIRRKGSDWNMPTQRAMDLNLFEIKETAVTHSDGHVTVSKTPKVTGKGQQYFISRFMKEEK